MHDFIRQQCAEFSSNFVIWRRKLAIATEVMAVLENLLMYLTVWVVQKEQGFYNKLQAHMLAFSWLDSLLFYLACMNTLYLMMMLVVQAWANAFRCPRIDIYKQRFNWTPYPRVNFASIFRMQRISLRLHCRLH